MLTLVTVEVVPWPLLVTVTVLVMADEGVGQVAAAGTLGVEVTVTVLADGQVDGPPPSETVMVCVAVDAGGQEVPWPPTGVEADQVPHDDESRAKRGLAFASKL